MTKEWKKHQATILDLYKVQGKTLNEVMDIMEKQYAFKASTRAYRSRFDRWDIRKYNKSARKLSTMTMPARLPRSYVGSERMLQRAEDSRSPSVPAPMMMMRSYSGPLPSRSPAYTPELACSELKPEYESSHSPGSSVSSQHHVELHQRLMHQQYYAAQPVQHSSQHIPIDGFADFNNPFQGLEHQHPAAIRDHHSIAGSQLRQHNGNRDEGDDCLGTFQTILESPMPSLSDSQRVRLFLTYIQRLAHQSQLNERRPGGANILEMYIQNYLSRDSIRDFCQIVAAFVFGGADTTHIIPLDFSHTVISASQAGRLSGINEAVRRHQQQGACNVPTCAAVWASACVESLKGNVATVDAHLGVLPHTVSEYCEIDIQALSALLPTRDIAGMPPLCLDLDKGHKAGVEHISIC